MLSNKDNETQAPDGDSLTDRETDESPGSDRETTSYRTVVLASVKVGILFFLLAETASIIPGQFTGFSIPGLGYWNSGYCQNTHWIGVVLVASLLPLVYLLFLRDRRGRVKLIVSGLALVVYLPTALLVQTVVVESIAVPLCGGYNADHMDYGNLFDYRDPFHYMSLSQGFHVALTYLISAVVAFFYLIRSVRQIRKSAPSR